MARRPRLPNGLNLALPTTLGKITETTFTGMLCAALMDRAASRHLLSQGAMDIPGSVQRVYASVPPIDVVVVSTDRGTTHLTGIEVKWRSSPSNNPGYKSKWAANYDIWLPPQIDRAHQIAQAKTCAKCRFRYACDDYCPRCEVTNADQNRLPAYRDRRWLEDIAKYHSGGQWRFVLLDYAGRSVQDAFPDTGCLPVWKSVSMYDVSQYLQTIQQLPPSLYPILAAFHSPKK